MKSQRYTDSRGFTLVELLVALAVGSIVLLGMISFPVFTTRAAIENNSQAYLQRHADLIIQDMGRQIRPASRVEAGPLVTCSTKANSLRITNLDPEDGNCRRVCYRRNVAGEPLASDLADTKIVRDLEKKVVPVCTGPEVWTLQGTWDLLFAAPVTLTTVDGPTLDGGGNCGTTAGFCPGRTGSSPELPAGAKTAIVTFQLRYRIPGSQSFQTMTFTTSISKRNS